jgi:chromosomal replication initiation ATPase DnaA
MRWVKQIYKWDMVSVDDLMDCVCEEFEITNEQLTSDVRKINLVDARMAFASIALYKMHRSTNLIAKTLKREHSMITYLTKRLADLEFLKDRRIDKIRRIEQKLFNQTTTI